MSTASKKRRKAREWMQTAKSRFVNEGHQEGFRKGAALMRDDMMKLVPDDNMVDRSDPNRIVIRQFIRRFPDPREHGAFFRVPMPIPEDPVFNSRIPARAKYVDFRPIQHAYAIDGPGGRARLEWYTWEPTEGSAEIEARTSVLLQNYGKLCAAASLTRSFVTMNTMTARREFAAMSDIVQAGVMLDEGVADIGRVLGKFAPVEQLSPREAFNRYIRYPMMNDRW